MKLTSLLLTLVLLTGCASMRRHPLVYGLVIGSAIGIGAGLATRGVHCSATTYEGKPYSGTSPGCPKPEPGEKR